MMELLRSWLIGVTAAAMIAAAAEYLTPEGCVKKIGKLAGGVLLLIAILQPVFSLEDQDISGILSRYRIETDGYSAALEKENVRLMKTIIEEETAAYIQDKAERRDMACSVSVTCQLLEDGTPYPAAVTVYGELTAQQEQELRRVIEEDIAIGAEDQRYERIANHEG